MINRPQVNVDSKFSLVDKKSRTFILLINLMTRQKPAVIFYRQVQQLLPEQQQVQQWQQVQQLLPGAAGV